MGVSISMKVGEQWESITPGWRSQMAEWLAEIGGDRETLAFTADDIPALEDRKSKQRIGEAEPPFDRSQDWVDCFDKIIQRVKDHGVALVQLNY